MTSSISNESTKRLQKIIAKRGTVLTLEEAVEFGNWLLELFGLLLS
jgi:hypothetical protein